MALQSLTTPCNALYNWYHYKLVSLQPFLNVCSWNIVICANSFAVTDSDVDEFSVDGEMCRMYDTQCHVAGMGQDNG